MERIIDDYDIRRRAEEIYSRRNGMNIEKIKKKSFSIYKFLFQLLVLINLAICFVLIKNKDFIFSVEFLNQVNEFYNINVNEKINEFFMEENVAEDNNKIENVQTENIIEENKLNIEEKNNNSTDLQSENNKLDNSVESQIKNSYSFIIPVNGAITSFFGKRESSNKNVSGNHTGIDISAIEGTKIKSAITGKVIEISNKGNYGNHLKIQNQDIITLYAHCKTIFVKQGDEIIQGQDIAEVGNTGNTTGPHLHFEIRYMDKYIDPQKIINF